MTGPSSSDTTWTPITPGASISQSLLTQLDEIMDTATADAAAAAASADEAAAAAQAAADALAAVGDVAADAAAAHADALAAAASESTASGAASAASGSAIAASGSASAASGSASAASGSAIAADGSADAAALSAIAAAGSADEASGSASGAAIQAEAALNSAIAAAGSASDADASAIAAAGSASDADASAIAAAGSAASVSILWSGSGAPSNGLGQNTDFYIDTTAWQIYGPKTGGAWGAATDMLGADGASGAAVGRTYYPDATASDLYSSLSYLTALTIPSGHAKSEITATCATQNVWAPLGAPFATEVGQPDALMLPAGTAYRYIYVKTSGGTCELKVQLFQYKTTGNVATTGAQTNISFNGAGNPDTISRTTGSFITDGFTNGCTITVSGAANGGNNGNFIAQDVTALTMTLRLSATLTTESAGASVTITTKEKLLREGASASFTNTTTALLTMSYADASSYAFDLTDRIVFKWWARKTTAGGSQTVTADIEGTTTASRIQTTLGLASDVFGLTAGKIPKAANSTSLVDSAVTETAGVWNGLTAISFGSNYSTQGAVRLACGAQIDYRNVGNSGNLLGIQFGTAGNDDDIWMGDGSAVNNIYLVTNGGDIRFRDSKITFTDNTGGSTSTRGIRRGATSGVIEVNGWLFTGTNNAGNLVWGNIGGGGNTIGSVGLPVSAMFLNGLIAKDVSDGYYSGAAAVRVGNNQVILAGLTAAAADKKLLEWTSANKLKLLDLFLLPTADAVGVWQSDGSGNVTVATTLAAVNGSAVTNLNGSNIASGTVADARLPTTMDAKVLTTMTAPSFNKSAPAISSGTLTLDYAAGPYFEVDWTSAITTLTLTNWPATGKMGVIHLTLKMDGTVRTVPSTIGGVTCKWEGATKPVSAGTSNHYLAMTFLSCDALTTLRGFVNATNMY